MSIKRALAQYLLDRETLAGPAAVPFTRVRTISGIACRDRNDARRGLQSKIGDRVYFDRRPQDIRDHTAIVIQTLSATPDYGLAGQVGSSEELVQLTAFARGGDAGRRAEAVGDLLSLAVSGFAGDYWGSTYVGECRIESQMSDAEPPPDATDDWLFTRRLDLSILYADESAAEYAAEVFAAAITWGLAAGVGPDLRLSAAGSTIPEGRTVVDVAWELRTGSATGPIAIAFSGDPNLDPATAGVTGTTLAPSIDRTTYGLSGVFVYVSLTLTDDAGNVVSITDGRYE